MCWTSRCFIATKTPSCCTRGLFKSLDALGLDPPGGGIETSEAEMAEKDRIRVAAVQIAPDLDTPTGTLDRVLAATAEAASKGARLRVFSETLLPWDAH